MNEMWTTLERYQPYADKRGFGPEWRRMCEERTADATEAARAIEHINRAIAWEEKR